MEVRYRGMVDKNAALCGHWPVTMDGERQRGGG